LNLVRGRFDGTGQINKVFLLLFVHKKKASLTLPYFGEASDFENVPSFGSAMTGLLVSAGGSGPVQDGL
jgi:hypothetical protein